jgi:hypothetical protein
MITKAAVDNLFEENLFVAPSDAGLDKLPVDAAPAAVVSLQGFFSCLLAHPGD